MEENRFQTPDSNLIDQNEVELQLASRWARLGASILDAIIMMKNQKRQKKVVST